MGKRRVADALGGIDVDADVDWGAQTQRAVEHFAIGVRGGAVEAGERMPLELLRALVLLKGVAAVANGRLGVLPSDRARAIDAAASALLLDDDAAFAVHFPLSLWQSGSGTQSHMNVNEVLARRATAWLHRADPQAPAVHPNDEVNRGQSSNDSVPSAMHVAVCALLQSRLQPALTAMADALAACAERAGDAVKLGRTHLQDAVPLRAAAEIGAWRSALLGAARAIDATLPALHEVAVGGTAVGSGLNAHPGFAAAVCEALRERTDVAYAPAPDRYAALAGHEPLVALHGALKTLAVALMRIANDIRLLASGPRGGFCELVLPANEPGSSIMPGKVNPTQCEALVMVACQVIGNDTAVTHGAVAGHLQLNTCKPLIAANVLRSLRLLADAMTSFEAHALRGLQVDANQMRERLDRSLMLVTALTPHIGYDRAAAIAHRAHEEGTTLREAALALGVQPADFDRWADPETMLGPSPSPSPSP